MATPIRDEGNWERLAPISRLAALDTSFKTGFAPIAPIYVTVSGTNIVIVELRSDTAKAKWWLGGSATRLVDATLNPNIIALPIEMTPQRELPLNKQIHLYYPDDGASLWTLKIDIAHWLQDIKVYIHLYRGTTSYSSALNGGGFEATPAGQSYDGGYF